MKLGIDARILTRNLTGIGRYVLELSSRISKDSKLRLYLFSPSPILAEYKQHFTQSTVFIESNCHAKIARQLWASVILPKRIKACRVDIFWGPAHRLPKKIPGVKYVLTIHDLVWKYAPQTMRTASRCLEKWQMPHAVQQANLILTVSNATKKAVLKEFKPLNSPVITLYPAAATAPKTTAANLPIPDLPYILFVGTIEPRKNLLRLLKAYALLSDTLKWQTKLVIAGGKGWGNVRLQAHIKQLNLTKYVKVLNYVNDQLLHALYQNAYLLAMPSLYEGFGLPLVEAMHYGVPVLTSNRASMPEVAGSAGIVVDPEDVNSIRHGLDKLLTDKTSHATLSRLAKQQAKKFNWDKVATKLIGFLQEQ